MFSAIRRRIRVSPATVIAGLALVFAMTGGAYAAKKYLITSTKQISPSVLKQLQGKAGLGGAPGVAGAQGAQGPAGSAGPAGSGGAKGETGAAGEKGVQGEKGATGPAGKEGKAGAAGVTGATGVSGFTSTLPSGETETGTWAVVAPLTTETAEIRVPISFPIPLAKGVAEGEEKAFFFTSEQVEDQAFGTTGCKWELEDVNAKPESTKPGVLCVFEQRGEKIKFVEFQDPGEVFAAGYAPSGAYLFMEKETTGAVSTREAVGTWAVTAP
jgi:Collagen triple helix repeat (20 copies)